MDNKNQKKDRKQNNLGKDLGAAGQMLTISSTLAAGVLLGFFSGSFLDKKLGTDPWLTLVMLVLGIAGGFKSVYSIMFSKKDED